MSHADSVLQYEVLAAYIPRNEVRVLPRTKDTMHELKPASKFKTVHVRDAASAPAEALLSGRRESCTRAYELRRGICDHFDDVYCGFRPSNPEKHRHQVQLCAESAKPTRLCSSVGQSHTQESVASLQMQLQTKRRILQGLVELTIGWIIDLEKSSTRKINLHIYRSLQRECSRSTPSADGGRQDFKPAARASPSSSTQLFKFGRSVHSRAATSKVQIWPVWVHGR
jgi:hypothetical protein